MTIRTFDGRCEISCDHEGCKARLLNLHPNPVQAQRAANKSFGWRSYNEGGFFKNACPKHVNKWKEKERK